MKKKLFITLMLGVVIVGLGAYTIWHDKARFGETSIADVLSGASTLWQDKARESAAGNIASDSLSATGSLISTAQPAQRTFTVDGPWIGIVESQASIELTALVAGRVEIINAEDERLVEKGQRVMRIGGPKIEDARAKLTTEIESLETQVQLAQETLVRLEENLKTRLATKDQLAAAQEAKVRLEAQLRDARLNLKTLDNQSTITAPIKGVFTNRQVSAGQDVAAGQIVGDIIDTGRLRIAASLFPPRDIELQGKEATIRLNANRNVTGVVRKVLPRTSSTGAVTVWIEGPQIDALLHPGQTVGGNIVAESIFGVLAVPESAIVYDAQDHPFLFIRKDGGAYERLGIQTGMEQDGWVEVLSGLKEDQSVVVRGAYELFYRNFNEQFKVQD